MPNHLIRSVFPVMAILTSNLSLSTAQPQIDAQLRPRFEIRDGYQKLAPRNAVPAAFISQRTRLGIMWNSDMFSVRISPQDVRIWGDEQVSSATGVFGDQASVELFDAYVALKLSTSAWMKIGRQQLVYDNEWLLSARNWNQQGIAYDAIVAMIKPGNWDIHLGASWNTLRSERHNNFYPADRIKSLNYLWIGRPLTDVFKVSLMHISAGYTKNDATNRMNFTHTIGLHPVYNDANTHLNGNIKYQYGINHTQQRISAYLLAAEVLWKNGTAINPGAGFSYLSGNSSTDPGVTENNLFNMHYGARHRHLGFMDYFSNVGPDTSQGGVADYHLRFNYSHSGPFSFYNTFHLFRLAEMDPMIFQRKHLGWENDLIVRYIIREGWTAELGYCFFLPGKSLSIIHSVSDNKFSQFIYLQLTVFQGLTN